MSVINTPLMMYKTTAVVPVANMVAVIWLRGLENGDSSAIFLLCSPQFF